MMCDMLNIEKISKQYKNGRKVKMALNGVSMQLEPGVHALLGPNGAGKTTLMNLLTCNLKASGGKIYWQENGGERQEINRMGKEYRKLVGYAPQQQGLYEAFSGYRFLEYMSVLKKIPKRKRLLEIGRVADSVHLSGVLDNRIRSYSGGMKQRLLVAQALLGDPKILIFDEPTVGLDPNERVRLREYIQEISEGKIVLLATHVVSDVESIADDVIVLKAGNIVEKNTVEALCQKYGVNKLEHVYIEIFSGKTPAEA